MERYFFLFVLEGGRGGERREGEGREELGRGGGEREERQRLIHAV